MIFKQLGVKQFRNIKTQLIQLNPGLNVFRGQNGQGKTNLIEALYLLTSAKSFRTNHLEDMAEKGRSPGFFLKAEIASKGLNYSVELLFSQSKRSLKVNEQSWTAPKIQQNFPSLLFSPESLMIVKDSPQKRRDLLDELCLSLYPQYSSLYAQFKKALRQKNRLLKSLKGQENQAESDNRLYENLTQLLLQTGAKLTLLRLNAIEEIQPFLLEEFLAIMDEHYGNISIDYSASGKNLRGYTEQEILNAMYKRWEELKPMELASGLCLVGPHKHDVQFNFNDQQARFFCSQGQQRAIILAFKMAQTRLHYRAHKEFPILLLDDVLSELDREKQMRFVNYLLSTKAQIFLTTTDATTVPQIAAPSVFEVREGVFTESNGVLTGGLSV